ncbi:unnamed protein product [Closterium sp. Yama58-4]|nr:unnamed protein product [Closterium sp. Yama58-4]
MTLIFTLPFPSGILSFANRTFYPERSQRTEGFLPPRGFYPAVVFSANRGIRCTSAPAPFKGTRPLHLPRRASRRALGGGGGGCAMHIANAAMRREPGGADDNRTEYNRTEYNRTLNVRTGGRVLTPEEHWQRYRPQLATRYGHWRFWLPAQGREAKLSLELLREITPVEVESGAEEYVLRHEQFNRWGDFPAKVAEGAWPFSCARASHTNGISLPYGIYSHGARVLCAGGDEEGEGGEAGDGDEWNGGGAVVMAQLQVGGDRPEGRGEGKGEGRGEGVGEGKGEGEEGERDKGRGKGSTGAESVRRAVLLTANVCFMDASHRSPLLCLHRLCLTGPGAQLNVAFSESSLSLRQDDTVLPTGRRNKSHTTGSAASYQYTDGTTSPSSQSLHDTWASPHWKTPLPTHLPASLPPLPSKPLYGVPHYIYADLYATPLSEQPSKRLETQNKEVFSGYLAGVPEAQQSRYGVWALPRGVVVAMPSPLEPMLSREGGGEGKQFWLVVTYVRGGRQGVQGGSDGICEERRGVVVGGGGGEEEQDDGIEDTGYMAEGEWKVQQVVIAYDAQGRFAYVKHTRFM